MALLPPLCFVWRHSCYPSWTLLAGWPPGVFSISAAVGSLSTQPELRGKGAAGRDLRITWLGLHMSLGPTCASGELLTCAHQNALRMRRTFALFWAPGPLAGRIWFCVRPPVRPAQFSPTLGCDDECPFYARLSGLTAVQGGGAFCSRGFTECCARVWLHRWNFLEVVPRRRKWLPGGEVLEPCL